MSTFFPFGIPSTSSYAETASFAQTLRQPAYSAPYAISASNAPPGTPGIRATSCPPTGPDGVGYDNAISPVGMYTPVPSATSGAGIDRSNYVLCFAINSPTPTPTNTITPTVTATNTSTVTVTPTSTRTQTPTNSPTETPTNTPTNTPTITPTVSDSQTPTQTPTSTRTVTPTVSDSQTPTNTPTVTPTISNSSTPTRTPTISNSKTPTVTPTISNSQTPTNTITPTNTRTRTPSRTPTYTPTNTITPTISDSQTPTRTPTISDSQTPTRTPTISDSQTPTNTPTRTRTPTNTRTPSPSCFDCNVYDTGYDFEVDVCSLSSGYTVYLSGCNGLLYFNSLCQIPFDGYISTGGGTYDFYNNGSYVSSGVCPSAPVTPTPTSTITPTISDSGSPTPTPTSTRTPTISDSGSPTPTPTRTPTRSVSGPFSYVLYGNGAFSKATACASSLFQTYYSSCSTLTSGCVLYEDASLTLTAASGWYRTAGNTAYELNFSGEIISIDSC